MPTKTWFQFEPDQEPSCELRVIHCCWEPDWICPSIFVSDIQPPEDQPPSESARLPRTCMRRYGAACETAHRSSPPGGVTERPSAERQKFWVAFCEPSGHQSASACTAPLMFTASGVRPSPATWVKKPTFASTLYEPGLNSRAYRALPNWLATCWLKTVLSRLWMADCDIDGSKIVTFGPRSGLPLPGGTVVGGVVGPPETVHFWLAPPPHVQSWSFAPSARLLSLMSRHLFALTLTRSRPAVYVHCWLVSPAKQSHRCTTAPSLTAPFATSRHLPRPRSDLSSPCVQVWLGLSHAGPHLRQVAVGGRAVGDIEALAVGGADHGAGGGRLGLRDAERHDDQGGHQHRGDTLYGGIHGDLPVRGGDQAGLLSVGEGLPRDEEVVAALRAPGDRVRLGVGHRDAQAVVQRVEADLGDRPEAPGDAAAADVRGHRHAVLELGVESERVPQPVLQLRVEVAALDAAGLGDVRDRGDAVAGVGEVAAGLLGEAVHERALSLPVADQLGAGVDAAVGGYFGCAPSAAM
nr:hypothetical protein GCM10020092_055160 [Actinoplanes digitatis]